MFINMDNHSTLLQSLVTLNHHPLIIYFSLLAVVVEIEAEVGREAIETEEAETVREVIEVEEIVKSETQTVEDRMERSFPLFDCPNLQFLSTYGQADTIKTFAVSV